MEQISRTEQLNYLIDLYGDLVFSICYKISENYFDAQDLTQETFLSAYQNLSSFDGANEKAWVCKIATNKCLDFKKSAKRRILPTGEEYFLQIEDNRQSPEHTLLEKEIKLQLKEACSQLKSPYKEVALQYFYEEKSLSEIAAAKKINPQTLRTQIYRAKAMLRKQMKGGNI